MRMKKKKLAEVEADDDQVMFTNEGILVAFD